jgi:ACT domain-containing protein
MRAVISVVGRDHTGILAYVAGECSRRGVNIEDVTQKVLEDFFVMMMIVTLPNEDHKDFVSFVEAMEAGGKQQGLAIHVMHEDIFNAMHTI